MPARAALAGNPSDLHGGAVLAIPVRAFRARARVVNGSAEPHRLVDAVLARVGARVALAVDTDIPRSVGLAGSSAIVIAALRAAGIALAPLELAQLALTIERDDLGIVAGLQDRAVQAFDAPVFVDVRGPAPVVSVVTPAAPLAFVVAWDLAAAQDSGDYHRGVGGADMSALADAAVRAADAFRRAEITELADAMGESAARRREVAPLPPGHEALADHVRAAGLVPNSAGSGGAVVAVLTPEAQLDALRVPHVVERVTP